MLTADVRSLILVGAIVLYALLSFASNEPRVSFVRPHRIVTEDDATRWQIRVEPHAENRLLIVAAVEGGEVVRRSDEQLDGDKAPRTRWIDWRGGTVSVCREAR